MKMAGQRLEKERRKMMLAAAILSFALPVALPFVGGAEVSVALDCGCLHGHSPIWDASLKRLNFVDIEGQKVLSYDPATQSHQEVNMLERVGCVVPYVQNRLLVAGEERIYQLGFQGKRRVLRRLPGHTAMVPARECLQIALNPDETGLKVAPGARFHSGSCDAQGRMWLSFKRTTGERDTGFYSLTAPPEWASELDPGGVVHQYGPNAVLRERAEVSCRGECNGIAWAVPSKRQVKQVTMYFVDAGAQSIKAMAYDSESGVPDPASCRTVMALGAQLSPSRQVAGAGEAERRNDDGTDTAGADEHDEDMRTQSSGWEAALRAGVGAPLAGELGGLALDVDGYIWVPLDASARLGTKCAAGPAAAPGAAVAASPRPPCSSSPPSFVIRVDPNSGKIDRCIDVGARRPTACAFGGDTLDDLYVTTRYAAWFARALLRAWFAARVCARVGRRSVGVDGRGCQGYVSSFWRQASAEMWRRVAADCLVERRAALKSARGARREWAMCEGQVGWLRAPPTRLPSVCSLGALRVRVRRQMAEWRLVPASVAHERMGHRSSGYQDQAASEATGSPLLHAQDLLRVPATERGDGALLRLRVEGVRGQRSAFAFERAIPPPFVDIPDWTLAD